MSVDLQGYSEYISSLPLTTPPAVFGLHDNADITKDLQESQLLLDSLLLTQSSSTTSTAPPSSKPAGGARTASTTGAAAMTAGPVAAAVALVKPKSQEDVIAEVAADLLARLPPNFDLEAAETAYPQDYYNSMNMVLVQELGRFNALLTVVRSSLVALDQACKGLSLMSSELDAVGRALFDGKVRIGPQRPPC